MAAPQGPAAVAATLSSILFLPPLRTPPRKFSLQWLSGSKHLAFANGGCASWRSRRRGRMLLRVGIPGPSKMTELVRAPDGFEMSNRGGDEEDGGSRTSEAVVLRNGSLEFRVDLTSEGLEGTLNKLSKWVVAVLFGIVIIWKHDEEAMWAAMGSVVNAWLSKVLKQILNHERPDPSLKSEPGMPSSHAQSIFYFATFVVISLVDSLGINVVTLTIGAFTLGCSLYLSWLRVSQRFHTLSQVSVGAALGSAFSLLWFWLWHAYVLEAFASSVSVRISIILVSLAFCVGFLIYVVQHWLKDDE